MTDNVEMQFDGRALMGVLTPTVRRLAQVAARVPDEIMVRGLAYPCWRCKRDDLAVVLLHRAWDGAETIRAEGPGLAYAKELLELAGHPQAATIKVRRSRTAGESLLSNGCSHCDALFGEFPLGEALAEVESRDGVDDLPVLLHTKVPALEWSIFCGLAGTSDFREEEAIQEPWSRPVGQPAEASRAGE